MPITTMFDQLIADSAAHDAEVAAAKAKAEAKRKAAAEKAAAERRAKQLAAGVERFAESFMNAVIKYYQSHLAKGGKKWSEQRMRSVQQYCLALVAPKGTLPPIEDFLARIVNQKFAKGFVLMHANPDHFQIPDGLLLGQRMQWFEEVYASEKKSWEEFLARKAAEHAASAVTDTTPSEEAMEDGEQSDSTSDYTSPTPLTTSIGAAFPSGFKPATTPKPRRDGRPGHGPGQRTKADKQAAAPAA